MVTKELIKYANEQLRAGHSAEAIKNAIISSGYTEEEANSALASAKSTVSPRPTAPPMKNESARKEEQRIIQVPVSFKIQTAAIPFDPKASRIELVFIRWLWSLFSFPFIIFGIAWFSFILAILFLLSFIFNTFNVLTMFLFGRRLGFAFNTSAKLIEKKAVFLAKICNYIMRRQPYFDLLTDKRPDKFGMEEHVDREETGAIA